MTLARNLHEDLLQRRDLIEQAKTLDKGKNLIRPRPQHLPRLSQIFFHYQCERVGIHGFHDHRHFYAQCRYKGLTGQECPARGGTKSKQLKQKQIDRQAREVISRE